MGVKKARSFVEGWTDVIARMPVRTRRSDLPPDALTCARDYGAAWLSEDQVASLVAEVEGARAAVTALLRVPDVEPERMTRAQVREMWLAVTEAHTALRPGPESRR